MFSSILKIKSFIKNCTYFSNWRYYLFIFYYTIIEYSFKGNQLNKYKVIAPLLGFEQIDEVELIKGDGISAVLQGTCENYLKLTLIHTYYDKENDLKIPNDTKKLLEIDENSNISVYLIVILDKDIENSTINLCSPLIFNEDNKTMVQAIITDDIVSLN